MEIECLLTSVYNRPAIWDSREKKHADRDFIAKQWEEIGKDLNCEGISYQILYFTAQYKIRVISRYYVLESMVLYIATSILPRNCPFRAIEVLHE